MMPVREGDVRRLLLRMSSSVNRGHGMLLEPYTLAMLMSFVETVGLELERLRERLAGYEVDGQDT